MSITDSGFVFSIDAAIAFLLALCIISLALNAAAENVKEKAASEKEFELWKSLVFIADSLVKNRDSENSLLGSAVFDAEKHRIKSNEIDVFLLKKMREIENREFELKEVKIIFENSEEKVFFQKDSEKKNCLAIERIVLISGAMAKIAVVGCNE